MATISENNNLLDFLVSQRSELEAFKTDALSYGSSTEVTKYVNEIDGYLADIDDYTDTIDDDLTKDYLRLVDKISYEIPNSKDNNQWIAGGYLRNDTYAGGGAFSPTSIPAVKLEKSYFDQSSAMLNGNFEFLNVGFGIVQSMLYGGMLDLMMDLKQSETIVRTVSYTIAITDTVTGEVLAYRVGESSFGGDGGNSFSDYSTPTESFDALETKAMWDAKFDVPQTMFENPVSLAFTAYDLFSAKEFSFSQNIGRGLLGTTFAVFSNAITTQMAGALGITGIAPSLAFATFAKSVLGELAEMALGIDNSFGFGGELQENTYGKNGTLGFEEGYNLDQSLGHISKATGLLEYNYDVKVKDKSGNVIGSNSYYGYDGTSDSYGVDVTTNYDALNESYTHQVSIDDIGTYSTIGDGGYSFDGTDGSFESNVDGISVTSNPMGGYDVNGVDTLGNDISYSTNSTGDFSFNSSSSSNDSDSSSGSDNDNGGQGDTDSDGPDDGTSDNGW